MEMRDKGGEVNARQVLHCFRNNTLLNGDGNRGRREGLIDRSLEPVMQPEPIVTPSWINSSLCLRGKPAKRDSVADV